jgi:hypothetical protein
MTIKWEIQHFTLLQGWVNTWTEEFDGEELPVHFASQKEAQEALDEYLSDIQAEIKFGYRDPETGYSRSEFRVVPVKTEKVINAMHHAVGHKTGSLHGLSADEIQNILNVPQVPDDEAKVCYSWAFKCDGHECGVWDYYNSSDRLNFSTYGPHHIFIELFGDHYKGGKFD